MSCLTIFRKLGKLAIVLGALLLFAQSKCLASIEELQEQRQSQQTPPPPSAPPQSSQPASQQAPPNDQSSVKHRKVWTNDDLILLRTPADIYLAEKEAREAAEAEAAAKLADQPQASTDAPLETSLPSSIEETQLMIKNTQQDIIDAQAVLASLNAELPSVPEEQKKAKEKEIAIVTGELNRAQNQLNAMQDHLADLQKPPASETQAAPPPPN